MRILIYGHAGWIGKQFQHIVNSTGSHEVILGQARCDDIPAVKHELATAQPDRVVLFIGRTHGTTADGREWPTIDYLEQPGKLVDNVRDNLFSPLAILLLCNQLNIHVTYLGTGCIFKYLAADTTAELTSLKTTDQGMVPEFGESSDPNFFGSSYSIVKGFTDRLMRLCGDELGFKCLNLRIRMPITGDANPRNFITKITTYQKICSIPNSMSVLDELLPAALQLIEHGQTGTLNFTNPGVISHDEILTMYREIVDPGFKWANMSLAEQSGMLASARSNNYLDTAKLTELCSPDGGVITVPVRPIQEAVRLALVRYRNTAPEIRVLVTGGCGFIGSNFVNYMMAKYPSMHITNIDAMYYCSNEANIKTEFRESGRYILHKVNLQDYTQVLDILKADRPKYIVHFAAQSHVDTSFTNSIKFTQDNVVGTHNLLEAVRESGIVDGLRHFIHVSTDEVYGESMIDIDEKHKTEHSVLCPTNPYAATKAGAELIASSYRHSFGLPIIITRGNNVYGPNQYPEKLIPRFIKLLQEGRLLTIAGKGEQIRSFLHADDTVRAFELIMFCGKIGEIYNIGTHDEYSVLSVAKLCIELWHGVSLADNQELDKYVEYIPDRPYNDMRYFISNQKVLDLGWSIERDFKTGLSELIQAAKPPSQPDDLHLRESATVETSSQPEDVVTEV